ncbi:2Fe-2S iron-sulfur cluster-binding protein [Thaumasiovibrio subtropicus]|uniref:2Fe-2S iron-sulfur cluster-binding protein n=1 Tax=Thaumasiovibrio subtropicus TaxID=1891207 RepID=UPI000B363CAE|nr:2Fe-2S iron-sulfur cluster-binding protein [Thaumasiovibrio subtropicus]
MYTIRLMPHNLTFLCDNNHTVLEAALNAGVHFPNRCQVGACAACLCKKTEGEVSYALEPMLTENEQQEGWIFACLAKPTSDLILQLD